MFDQPVDLTSARVLMVDDTPANIDVLRKVLTPEGYKLYFANNGEKALQIAEKAMPDLILLDVMMPGGIDGFTTCTYLKQNALTATIPVIFITAKTDTQDMIEGFRVGAVDYITKPFRQEEVCVRVRTHLQTRILMHQRDKLIQDLKTSEERFRLLAMWSPAGIFQTDLAGNFTYTNQRWQAIFAVNNHITDDWLKVLSAEDKETIKTTWQTFLNNPERTKKFSYKCQLHISEGVRWVQIVATPLVEQNGKLAGYVGSVEDITDFKYREEQMLLAKESAEEKAQARAEFLAGMTHELRTPLNAIIGYSEMLLEEAGTEEDGEDLEKITSASKYLLNLINNVLDLSKLEANKMTANLSTVGITPLVKEVVSMISPLVAKNGNELLVEIHVDIETIYADDTKLRQVLYNLLSNACKFTTAGTIRLHVYPKTVENTLNICFAVADTGIGMTEEQLKKLFNKYAQATEATASQYGGTGLGLVLSQQFCRLLGGEITVSSELNKGSVFTAVIPSHSAPTLPS
ncbi:response regulator [Beggiatoa leptomitoformis]|uniref:histidine kinase n=1 Tax=Beggiatoa leptomitoformis TaxID=288004 RepID=A0A2N9YG90_9GAMM|nr:response regulator [Beggiatoa leptomitoformis]AUI69532.1 response regulator [Beggiatoa leptomitoformis]QGX03703.1 response regulator [Beggiatoa leptomitoformis]